MHRQELLKLGVQTLHAPRVSQRITTYGSIITSMCVARDGFQAPRCKLYGPAGQDLHAGGEADRPVPTQAPPAQTGAP